MAVTGSAKRLCCKSVARGIRGEPFPLETHGDVTDTEAIPPYAASPEQPQQ